MTLKRIIIATGGTGGHIYPAQATALELSQSKNPIEILFAGSGLGENCFFSSSTFCCNNITAGKFYKNPFKFLWSSWAISKGVFQSFQLFKKFRPNLLVGFGSYHTIPLLIAAKLSNIPFVLYEANCVPGKTNALFASHARFIGVNFPILSGQLKGKTAEVSFPLKKEYFEPVSKQEALNYYGLSSNKLTVLIFGGSQGALGINKLIKSYLPLMKFKQLQFIHLAGEKENLEELEKAYSYSGVAFVLKKFETKMHLAWKAADIFIGRSGASTLAESLHTEVPGILIPYPHAVHNHQNENANFFIEKIKGGLKLEEHLATKELLEESLDYLLNPSHYLKIKHHLQAYKRNSVPSLGHLILREISAD